MTLILPDGLALDQIGLGCYLTQCKQEADMAPTWVGGGWVGGLAAALPAAGL